MSSINGYASVDHTDSPYAPIGATTGRTATNSAPEDDLQLPPNVREYLRKVNYYRSNNITLDTDPAKEFGIGDYEKRLIKHAAAVNQRRRTATGAITDEHLRGGEWREHAGAPLKYRTHGNDLRSSTGGSVQWHLDRITGSPETEDAGDAHRVASVVRDARGTAHSGTTDQHRHTLTTSTTKDNLNTAFYKPVPFRGSGSGGGSDMMINNRIHFGENSRTLLANKKTSSEAIDRFEPLLRDDFQQPDHVVLPFPRGGIDTRNFDRYSYQDSRPHTS